MEESVLIASGQKNRCKLTPFAPSRVIPTRGSRSMASEKSPSESSTSLTPTQSMGTIAALADGKAKPFD
jgi:hypothetical protein